MNQIRSITPEQKGQPHWTDSHIRFDTTTSEYIAFDEAGLEHSRWSTLNEARDDLVVYAVVELRHRPLSTTKLKNYNNHDSTL